MSQIVIEESLFGKLSNKQNVKKYKMTNQNGFSVSLISYGASIQAVHVKDKNGQVVNVALGFDTLEEYLANSYFGSTVGRVANRISNAEFNLNGIVHNLEKNEGKNNHHGGSSSLAYQNWASTIVDNYVKFSYVSPDGEGGFPGEVWFDAIYRLEENENILLIEYKAITDKPTPVSLTNHFFFNLNGHDSNETIRNHLIRINSDKILEMNSDNTVTGKVIPVESTKNDLRNYTLLSDRIEKDVKWPENGFDNFFISNDSSSDLKELASVKNPSNGIKFDLKSNQLGLFFYSGNFLDIKTSSGANYNMHHGFCLEAHNYPDSVNQESFPSCILNPDIEYSHITSLAFSIEN
ncbi:unnamed protein product [Brachionus calyciflorus]|uniref:Aldose 1-epimerase n=1 Tax=Brachionus calyciflorus TaxID=104777 RepID=A0A814LX22_9BILA|nr:unnamed protein product [Brachionus calyciflorus]